MSREDLLGFLGCAALVPAVWLGLGWRPDRLVMGYDAVTALLPMVATLADAQGDPHSLAWRDELLGGVAVRDTLGPQPWLLALAGLGLKATAVLNTAVFLAQALVGFFAQRLVADLVRILGGSAWPLGLRVPLAVLLGAFAPFLGWRVGYGHLTLMVGLLPFLAALAVLGASGAGTRTVFLTLIAVGTIASGLPFVGQQTLFYGFLFGAPLFLGLWRSAGSRAATLRAPALACLAGGLLAAPGYGPMLEHAFGSDALRDLGGVPVTYSYLTAQALDWLTSLPWARFALWGRADIYYHESNLPVGPPLLLLVLLRGRGRALLAGLGASLALAVAFASNLTPVSDLLCWAIPPLRAFRVPTRALMPALLVLPVAAMAGLALLPGRPWSRGQVALGAALGSLALVLPALPRELATWAVVVGALWGWRSGQARLSTIALAMALGGASLAGFRDRLLAFPPGGELLAAARAMGDAARAQEPALSRPLTRIVVDTDGASLGANAAFAAGLASLDGYGFPQRRFVALVRALRGEPYSAHALLLRFHEGYPGSDVLFQLYNVPFRLDTSGGVQLRGPTAGSAWFPSSSVEDPTLGDLAAELLAWGQATHERAQRTLRIVKSDPELAGAVEVAPACAEARVRGLERGADGRLSVAVSSPSACPLVLARNYATSVTAWAEGGRTRLRVFPAYGGLLGVVVPRGTERVEVRPAAWPPRYGLPAAVAGLAVLVALLRRRGSWIRTGR